MLLLLLLLYGSFGYALRVYFEEERVMQQKRSENGIKMMRNELKKNDEL